MRSSLVAIAFVSGSHELLSGFTGVAGLISAAVGCMLTSIFLWLRPEPRCIGA